MPDRIKLTEDDIHVMNHFGHYRVKFKSLEGDDLEWTISEAQQLKQQIINDNEKVPKLEQMEALLFDEVRVNHQLKEKLEKIETRSTNLNDEDELALAADIKEILGDK